ncbi:IclR family transcriptional regulator [Halorubrum sp. CBA1125]|uniref:IclR family transcriptional regulator n=1 Tax=Halorubrum sp. CBA1125 TaxID=2668072 RepID=UPI0018D1FC4E|nr:IclR family transcriptional regulator [Halorubrum sp. CBA1125]
MSGPVSERESNNRIKAVSTMFKIVESLRDRERTGVSELADRLDMPKSTVHVYLQTLADEGYVINEDGKYSLSHGFLEIGGAVRKQMSIYQAARPEIDALSADTGEVANLGIEEGGKRVLLYSAEPSEGVFDNSPVGQYTHMHWTALGKALLAQLPDERVDDVVDRHGLPEATENTITEREALFEALDRIRDRGYAVEDEERREGIKAIAVAFDPEIGSVPASAWRSPDRSAASASRSSTASCSTRSKRPST